MSMKTVDVLNATSTLLGVAIEMILRDKFYQDIIARMREEGRTEPTADELQQARERAGASIEGLKAEINLKETL